MKLFSILLLSFLVILLIVLLMLHFKKRKCIRQTHSLSTAEKSALLNRLTEPLGYYYNSSQDLFLSLLDAPQKSFGYHTFYDFAAAFFHMVFDYETIYFDYKDRTWLIEIWKGQYGICSGCELGVYYNETIVSSDQYKDTHFLAVAPKDMPQLTMQLYNNNAPEKLLGFSGERHWWLTIFKLPCFSKPQDLHVDISIGFQDYGMLKAFLDGFENTLPNTPYRVRGLTVSFPFRESLRKYRLSRRLLRRLALSSCHFLCNLFRFITRPFVSGGDKIIYLYFYLPFLVKILFRLPKSPNKE